MEKMKNYAIVALCILLCLLSGLGYFFYKQSVKYEGLYNDEKSNVETLIKGQKDYIIRDSIHCSEIKALTLSKDELENLYAGAKKEIKELKDHPKKEIEYITKFETITETKWKIDTVLIGNDSCQLYQDRFTNIMMCKDSVYVTTVDTINQFISKHYKHKFLWWKWKMDGITQDIYPTNPNSRIIFDEFVQVK